MDLSKVGSGRLLQGRSDEIARADSQLDTSGYQATQILEVMNQTRLRNEGRHDTTAARIAASTERANMLATYKNARSFSSGIVFYGGSGMLDTEAAAEVERRHNLRVEKKVAIDQKKKKAQRTLKKEVAAIKRARFSKFSTKIKTLVLKDPGNKS